MTREQVLGIIIQNLIKENQDLRKTLDKITRELIRSLK